MAALTRPNKANYEVHEQVTVDTTDNEDHTFCGIMFPLKCRDLLPMHHVVINSVAVRGQLGPLTVWMYNRKKMNNNSTTTTTTTGTTTYQISMEQKDWIKIYDKHHEPTKRRDEYQKLEFRNPIILRPGHVIVLYIHSSRPGDQSIVYDNRRERPRQNYRNTRSNPLFQQQQQQQSQQRRLPIQDGCLEILPARAHLSEVAFGNRPIWGWGYAWRDDREFVGRIEYGCVYRLWNPTCHARFAHNFSAGVLTLLLCQRRNESVLSLLPDDCIYYILNMCHWDWFQDGMEGYQQLRSRRRLAMAEPPIDVATISPHASSSYGVAAVTSTPTSIAPPSNTSTETMGVASRSCGSDRACINGTAAADDDDDDDEDDEDYLDDDDGDEEEEVQEENEDDHFADGSDGDDDDDDSEIVVDGNFFQFNVDSDDEGDNTNNPHNPHRRNNNNHHHHQEDPFEDDDETSRAWIRRQFARLHVLRALAAMDDNNNNNNNNNNHADVEMQM